MKTKTVGLLIALLLAGGAALAYQRRRKEKEYEGLVEGTDAGGPKGQSQKRYLRLTSAEAARMGKDVANFALSVATSPAQLDKTFAAMLQLQKDSFLEVYWRASEVIHARNGSDLIALLEMERFGRSQPAVRVLRVLTALVKKRYQPGPALPKGTPSPIRQIWASIRQPFGA